MMMMQVLEAIKLDMANSHLSHLLESDHTLRHAIASRPNDFVVSGSLHASNMPPVHVCTWACASIAPTASS